MGKYSTYDVEDLEVLKAHYYDDWNFGSGKESSLRALEAIETELVERKTHMGALVGGVTWHGSKPPNPHIGDAYFDAATGVGYIWTGSNWTAIASTGGL